MRDDAPAEDYDRAGRKIEDAQAMVAQRDLVPEGSAISRALDYSLKRWAALSRYLDDGAVPIENNWCENQIRPWALGRKNRLFAGRYAAENDMAIEKEVIGWKVVFEDGSVELHPAESIQGEPTFGRWITPMIAGGETIDLDPDADDE